MSKTNHTSYGAAAKSERELTKAELDAVVGGGKPKAGGFRGGKCGREMEHRSRCRRVISEWRRCYGQCN